MMHATQSERSELSVGPGHHGAEGEVEESERFVRAGSQRGEWLP